MTHPYQAPRAELDHTAEDLRNLDPRAAGLFRSTFEFRRKKTLVAYAWLVFFGVFGAHQFYLGNTRKGIVLAGLGGPVTVAQLLMDALPRLWIALFGLMNLILIGLLLWDLFLTPRQVRRHNERLRDEIMRDLHARQERARARQTDAAAAAS